MTNASHLQTHEQRGVSYMGSSSAGGMGPGTSSMPHSGGVFGGLPPPDELTADGLVGANMRQRLLNANARRDGQGRGPRIRSGPPAAGMPSTRGRGPARTTVR